MQRYNIFPSPSREVWIEWWIEKFLYGCRQHKSCTFSPSHLDVSIKSRTFAPNRTRHRFSSARNVAYQGGTFFVYTVMRYTKQLLSLQQQIDVLKQRGLLLENEEEAKNALDVISYFRLAGYWRLMEADRQQHTFKPNSRFSQIMSLYHFDEELRILLFSAIQHIEVAVRARIQDPALEVSRR